MNSAKQTAIRIQAEDTYTSTCNDIYSLKVRSRKLGALGLAARAIDAGNWSEALMQIAAARKENKI